MIGSECKRGLNLSNGPRRPRSVGPLAILATSASGCGEIGIHAGFRCLWALRPWRFESSQPHFSESPARERGFVVLVDLAGLRSAGRLLAALQRRALGQRLGLLSARGPLRPALAERRRL